MMRSRIFLFFLFCLSFQVRAQLNLQSLAVKKPRVPDTYTFAYTGAIQQFVVPNRVTSIQVAAIGARGGTGARGQVGGAGANITTSLNVTPGQILWIVVGGFPGQSATAAYGFGGNGGSGTNFGGAGGGLSGVFTSSTPAVANAMIVAGGGGGGSGNATGTNFTGGNAGNNLSGSSSNGNEENPAPYVVNGRSQFGYAASNSSAGLGGEPYDVVPGTRGGNGSDISGGVGGTTGGVSTWNGGGGGGAGFYGGGAGAGGGAACGGGAGGATKSSTNLNSYGPMNNTGNGSVSITCFSNSGLVLHLDAGNPASYSGSGSAWNDLSGNGSNATLFNTSYSSANGGSIVFNGTTSYADFNANVGNTNVVTVEMWVRTNSLTSPTGMYFGFNFYDVWTSGGNIGYNTSAGDQYGIPNTRVDYLGIVGGWRHLVFVMYTGARTNNKIYVNGESQSMSFSNGTFNALNGNFNSGSGRISGWRYDGGWKMNMNVASFKIYTRELSAQEITNNYRAYQSKYYAEGDGLSPATASSSAFQIKQDYPSSTDGFYWIKNANINSGNPVKIYADMTTDGGGWTLILKNSSNSVWNYANTIALNREIPFTSTTEVNSTSTASYSIVGWADFIKRSSSGFQYMIDAGSRRSFGGIWTANAAYNFTSNSNANTLITLNTKFGNWNYAANNNGISQRMPWYWNSGGPAYLTLASGSGNWWGTLVSNNSFYSPSPWISDANGGTNNPEPGIIWYWVR
jgi:hypothetical protein